MCETTYINADTVAYGVLTSRKYPTWEANVNCVLKIQSSNPNKALKFYITEIDIDESNFYTDEYF